MNRIALFAATVVLGAVGTSPVAAQTPGFTNTGGSNSTGGYNGTLGYTFSVQTAQRVAALGYYDAGSDGLAASHDVGLFDSSGALIYRVTVPSGTAGTLVNGFRYVTLPSSYPLTAGQTYTLGGYSAGDAYNYNSTVTSAPGITYGSWRYASGSQLADPTASSGTTYFGPNMLLAPAPEPATWALMIMGFGLAGVALRRRRSDTGAAALA